MTFNEYQELNKQVEDNSIAIVNYMVESNEDLSSIYDTMRDTGIDELQAYATVVTLLSDGIKEEQRDSLLESIN